MASPHVGSFFFQLFFSIFWHHSSIITSLWKRDDESQLILNSPSSDSEANFIINGNHQPSSSSGTTSLDVGFLFPKAGKIKTPVSQVSHRGFLVDKIMWSFSFSLFVHYIFDKLQESASDWLIVVFFVKFFTYKKPNLASNDWLVYIIIVILLFPVPMLFFCIYKNTKKIIVFACILVNCFIY